MIETVLYTRDGDEVATVWVPPFNPPAEVLLWGSRVFVRRVGGHYCEAVVYCPPVPATVSEQES